MNARPDPNFLLMLPMVDSSAFESGWYWWLLIGGIATVWLPLSFLLSNPTGAIDELTTRITINKLFQSGKYNPAATALEATGSVVLGGLVTLFVGPLVIWFHVGKPFLHEHDDSTKTLCCVEAPQPSSNQQLIYDFYRDDPFFLWRFLKTALFGNGDGEWKLTIIDVRANRFVNLASLGRTEENGRVLIFGKSDRSLEMIVTNDAIQINKWREINPTFTISAAKLGMTSLPRIEKKFDASGCAQEKSGDAGGLLGSITGLFRILIASKEVFTCKKSSGSPPTEKIYLFDSSQYWFTLKDENVHVFKSGFGYIKFVKL